MRMTRRQNIDFILWNRRLNTPMRQEGVQSRAALREMAQKKHAEVQLLHFEGCLYIYIGENGQMRPLIRFTG